MLVEYFPERLPNKSIASYYIGGIVLNPGFNDISLAQINEVRNDPLHAKAWQYRIDKGIILLNEATAADEVSSLNGLTVSKAISVVEETYNLALLERWKGEATNKAIIKAIEVKVADINTPQPGTEDKDK